MKIISLTTCCVALLVLLAGPASGQQALSEASRRANERGYDRVGADYHVSFRERSLRGDLAYEEGVIRRDPSSVYKIDGLYYVWYTRGEASEVAGFDSGNANAKVYPWDLTDIWYATSPDGWTWNERGLAVGRGPAGAFDDRAVFTPEVLRHHDKYYLVYQVVQAPYRSRTKNEVGMAIADSPNGPWRKLDRPILSPSDSGKWKGETGDRSLYLERGAFDSYKVHDPMLFAFNGKFYLYYKGQRIGEQLSFGGREINHGVAIAEHIEGPYFRSPLNPISNSGHEVAMWRHRGGLATLLTTDGPEKDTIQWSPDGINFAIKARIKSPPKALGIYRPDDPRENDALPAGLQWGLAHRLHGPSGNSLCRYDVFKPVLRDPGIKAAPAPRAE